MSESGDEFPEERQTRARCKRSGVPFANLARGDIADEVVESVPGELERRLQFVPVAVRGGRLVIALAEFDRLVVDEVGELLGRDIDVALTTANLLRDTLERYCPI